MTIPAGVTRPGPAVDKPPAEEGPGAGRDRRLDQVGPYGLRAPYDVQTEQMDTRIQAIHCRLLERATRGRMTFVGDQIVGARMPTRETT